MPCINLYPTIACVVCKNGNHKPNTIAQYAMKSSELSIKDFYCVFVRTEMNLIAFLGQSDWVNTQPYLGLCVQVFIKSQRSLFAFFFKTCKWFVSSILDPLPTTQKYIVGTQKRTVSIRCSFEHPQHMFNSWSLIMYSRWLIFVTGHLVTTPAKLFSIQTIGFWQEDVKSS